MKIKPKKTILLTGAIVAGGVILSQTMLSKNLNKLRDTTLINSVQILNEESLLIAACEITCLTTCGLTNRC